MAESHKVEIELEPSDETGNKISSKSKWNWTNLRRSKLFALLTGLLALGYGVRGLANPPEDLLLPCQNNDTAAALSPEDEQVSPPPQQLCVVGSGGWSTNMELNLISQSSLVSLGILIGTGLWIVTRAKSEFTISFGPRCLLSLLNCAILAVGLWLLISVSIEASQSMDDICRQEHRGFMGCLRFVCLLQTTLYTLLFSSYFAAAFLNL